MGDLRFDGRVVVITGAGAGLGRAYALLFASRGAKVVVNDLGGGRHGDGKSSAAADSVVQEIKSKGGIAVADYNSVTEGDKIIETALANFGRVDVVVNNAGILRDKSFARISDTDWNLIHDVHLKGAFKTTQAAWPHFQKQNYGRVIMTSSNSGLYGNFGQANYSAAKMGLVGLANTLAIEGRKKNIHCNVIVPTAASRLTEDILPPDFFAELRPELIAPVVVWLCHEKCQDSGAIIESAAGWAAKCELVRGVGSPLRLRLSDVVSPEDVQNYWERVTDMSQAIALGSIQEATGTLMGTLEQMRENATSSTPVEESVYVVTSKDSILYALGVGASLTDSANLKYLYENHEEFSALPSYACIPSQMAIMTSDISSQNLIPGRSFDLSQVLHGEQYVELFKPMPTSGALVSKVTVADVLDKGKGAVVLYDVDTYDESGDKVSYTQLAGFIVGAGGFGGKRDSPKAIPTVDHPRRNPDFTARQTIDPNQAALYRLSGDLNPLHIDPSFASVSGFPRPILHGLCSLGYSLRLVLKTYGDNNPAYCKAFKARFVKPVFPGETLKVDMWREGNRIHFETSVMESKNTVIAGAYMDLTRQCPVVSRHLTAATQLKSQEVFAGMQERINADVEKAKSVKGVFLWNITKGGKVEGQWTLDLKKGSVYKGEPEAGTKADTTLTIDDADMVDMALGKLNPQSAFMKGKLKIKGNIMLTQKLKTLISAEAKL
ncbi:peroxisomal multifunctional enzyme type 2 [Macrosteles quadrilineatus]|uniref:peroxisomal multifunctional enzyme type 2 n=1 Tax=Macrosteles quadrilineatus TaxID=74068 RepID=UPI0023E333A2|nr:peroxisomal multifunctional enzyme type 2 [Macrosteles quadrilineatus]